MVYAKETDELVGSLCVAWASLEFTTERTLWGLLGADEQFGPLITNRLDMRQRWELILTKAPGKLEAEDIAELKRITRHIGNIARDRNIIVHGLVHMLMQVPESGSTFTSQQIVEMGLAVHRRPCWTVFRGADAGKSFPASTEAVRIVRDNITLIHERVDKFNESHGYKGFRPLQDDIETDWPKPIE